MIPEGYEHLTGFELRSVNWDLEYRLGFLSHSDYFLICLEEDKQYFLEID